MDLPDPGIKLGSPALQADSLPAEPQWYVYIVDFPCGSMVKNLPANARGIRDVGSIPGLGRSPGGGHGNPLQYSCLENPHGQRSLAGYGPWGHKELDTTE